MPRHGASTLFAGFCERWDIVLSIIASCFGLVLCLCTLVVVFRGHKTCAYGSLYVCVCVCVCVYSLPSLDVRKSKQMSNRTERNPRDNSLAYVKRTRRFRSRWIATFFYGRYHTPIGRKTKVGGGRGRDTISRIIVHLTFQGTRSLSLSLSL